MKYLKIKWQDIWNLLKKILVGESEASGYR